MRGGGQIATIYERWDGVTGRFTEVVTDSETGLPLIRHVQDVRPIVESAKRISSQYDPHRRNPEGLTHVARIPTVIWRQLVRTGVAGDPRAFDAWLDGRDQSVFRTDGGRRLT